MDPGDFHTNWEERLWSRNYPEIDDLLLASWTTVEEPDWTHDNPILRHDPFTMNLTETDSFTDVVPEELKKSNLKNSTADIPVSPDESKM